MARATIKDVAELAGVSIAAVSRVLSINGSASPRMRAKVMEAADQLGYRPNALARSMINARTNLVALVIGATSNVFDAALVDGLADHLARRGKKLLLTPVVDLGAIDDELMGALDYQVDAAVVAAGTMTREACLKCAKLGVPVILSGRNIDSPGIDSVLADNKGGGRMAAELLMRSGCRRIAYVGGTYYAFSDQERRQGLEDALKDAGRDLSVAVKIRQSEEMTGFEVAMELLSRSDRPDGVFCINDMAAIGILQAAAALGLSVPEDVAVIGFDNTELASWPNFRLTTIDYPVGKIVDAIIEMLETRLAQPDLPARIHRVRTRMVVRDSTPKKLSPFPR
ncbi:LacI family DNA-binding transcriptional regulator [Denitrobaculum tricleocarpae]|uniref:LacI family transcriptional regulator n=1 Tax=Denitrobaculum tricleocarpae TaxID=2591009 RepID=A0A545TEQ9_9PROT|nr:LacI family DNA-binding transcriptional regulator [Denitrobaculum tricleocarpae]TQV75704.1 LacI family transcriptional regulator [Denitrobaculum tricleocarpae]